MSLLIKTFATGVLAIAVAACAGSPPDPESDLDVETSEPTGEVSSDDSLIEEEPDIEEPSSGDESTEVAGLPMEVNTFTSDELFAAGGGGCGMTLWEQESSPWNDGFLFFHGIEDDPAFMTFDGTLTQLERTEASGEEFYGQQTSQTFTTNDSAIIVQVDATLGDPGETESVSIPEAKLIIDSRGQKTEIPVVGDAGC